MCNRFSCSPERCSANCQSRVLVLASLRLYHTLCVVPNLALAVDSAATVRSHSALSTCKFDHPYYTPDCPDHLCYFAVSNNNDSSLRISWNQSDLHLSQRPRTVFVFSFTRERNQIKIPLVICRELQLMINVKFPKMNEIKFIQYKFDRFDLFKWKKAIQI